MKQGQHHKSDRNNYQAVFNCTGTLKLRPIKAMSNDNETGPESVYNCFGTLEMRSQNTMPGNVSAEPVAKDLLITTERVSNANSYTTEMREEQLTSALQICRYLKNETANPSDVASPRGGAKYVVPAKPQDNQALYDELVGAYFTPDSGTRAKESNRHKGLSENDIENILRQKHREYHLYHEGASFNEMFNTQWRESECELNNQMDINNAAGDQMKQKECFKKNYSANDIPTTVYNLLESACEDDTNNKKKIKIGRKNENVNEAPNIPVTYIEKKLREIKSKLKMTKDLVYQLSPPTNILDEVRVFPKSSGAEQTKQEIFKPENLTGAQLTGLELIAMEEKLLHDPEIENIKLELKKIFDECNAKIQKLLKPTASACEETNTCFEILNRLNYKVLKKLQANLLKVKHSRPCV